MYARPLLGGTRLLHERLQAHGRQVELTTPHQTHAFGRRGRVGCLCQGCEALAFGLGEGAFAEPRNELAAVRERGLPTYGCERGGARSQRSAVRVPSEIHIAEAAWWRCQGGEGAEGVKGGMVGTEKGTRSKRSALIRTLRRRRTSHSIDSTAMLGLLRMCARANSVHGGNCM